MAKNPFQIDDRVYVMPHGWGVVDMIHSDCVRVKFHDNIPVTPQFFDLKYVSFTEYDPINGGLSHERPQTKSKSNFPEVIKQLIEIKNDGFELTDSLAERVGNEVTVSLIFRKG